MTRKQRPDGDYAEYVAGQRRLEHSRVMATSGTDLQSVLLQLFRAHGVDASGDGEWVKLPRPHARIQGRVVAEKSHGDSMERSTCITCFGVLRRAVQQRGGDLLRDWRSRRGNRRPALRATLRCRPQVVTAFLAEAGAGPLSSDQSPQQPEGGEKGEDRCAKPGGEGKINPGLCTAVQSGIAIGSGPRPKVASEVFAQPAEFAVFNEQRRINVEVVASRAPGQARPQHARQVCLLLRRGCGGAGRMEINRAAIPCDDESISNEMRGVWLAESCKTALAAPPSAEQAQGGYAEAQPQRNRRQKVEEHPPHRRGV